MAEYIDIKQLWNCETCFHHQNGKCSPSVWCDHGESYRPAYDKLKKADVVEVVHGYHEGDVCIYGFGHENKSRAIVEIVRILNDERGVAEVKFHKVFVDDTGNGLFNYLLKSGKTMNASFQYLKNITPRMDGE